MQALFCSTRHHETFPIRLLTASAKKFKFKVLLVQMWLGHFIFLFEKWSFKGSPSKKKSKIFFESNFESSYFGIFYRIKIQFYMAWFENIWPYLLYSMTRLVNNLFRHFYHFLKIVSHLYQTRARSKIDKNLILLVNTQFNSYCQTIGSTFQINDHARALFQIQKIYFSYSLCKNVWMQPIWYFRQIF